MVLVGRESECARIDELLRGAHLGRSGALLLGGEAGIGKTALLEYAVGRADRMLVVSALGVESEAELEFSALLELCRPMLDHLPEVPARQADALRAALGLAAAGASDRFMIGAAVLSLLAAASEAHPVLVVSTMLTGWIAPPPTRCSSRRAGSRRTPSVSCSRLA